MIFGIGTDIVSVSRMAGVLARHGDRLARRMLAEAELAEYQGVKDKSRFLAKRFAAKEAMAKALGTGFRGGVSMHEIAVAHEAGGRPVLVLHGRTLEAAQALGIGASFLSISDEREHAIAFVTLTLQSS